jgi:hypothetical protein
MKKATLLLIGLIMLSIPSSLLAADYTKFQHDLVEAYSYYKKALSLTSKSDTQKKSIATMEKFIVSWENLTAKYKDDAPEPFAKLPNYSNLIVRPVTIGQQALKELRENNIKVAHNTLEEIRYLLWKMRTDAGLVTLSDKVNDFHEVMEIVLDKMAESKSVENFKKVGQRYGAWMEIKWEEQAGMSVFTADRDTFNKAIIAGRNAIGELRGKLAKGDIKAATAASKKVKKAYKTIFFLDSTS